MPSAPLRSHSSWDAVEPQSRHSIGSPAQAAWSPRQILTFCYEHPPFGGGGGQVARRLAEQLGGLGFATDFITMALDDPAQSNAHPAVTVHPAGASRRDRVVCTAAEMVPYLGRALIQAVKLLPRGCHEINQSHFIFPDGLICLLLRKLTGLPYMLTAHGSDVPGYNPHRFAALHRVLLPIWRLVVRNAAHVVCPSVTVERLIHASCGDAPTVVVPNGIEMGQFDPFRPRADRILTVARMLERKGVQYLIEALAGIDAPFTLHVVGEGPFHRHLRELAAARGVEVVFHGALANDGPELRELYETSAIFALASTAENFPMVLLEAMAAGAAIVTTAGTGCAEVVGDCADLVPIADVDATRAALLLLMRDRARRERLGSSARKRAENQFAATVVARQYAELINSAARAVHGERLDTASVRPP